MQPKTKSGKIEDKKMEEKMVDKVNQQMENEDESLMARVIGLGLVLFGFIFVLLTVVLLVLSTRPPRIDEGLDIPTVSAEQFTNGDTVTVMGTAPAGSTVMFFIDGEEVDETATADEDGVFEVELQIPDEEKDIEITTALVEGFPIRKRSKQSEPIAVTIDRTAPSTEAEIAYDPVSQNGLFTIQGKTEPNTTVTITDGENEFSAVSDESGAFIIEGIQLGAENTVFTLSLTDQAGNTVALEREITVQFPDYDTIAGGGDLNGDGATTGPEVDPDLPEASGELQNAMDTLFGNQLMMIFGLIALSMLFINGGLVAIKASRS